MQTEFSCQLDFSPMGVLKFVTMRLVIILTLTSVILTSVVDQPLIAQETQREETNVIHWAYAAAFGSGIYWVGDDRQIYVLRIQPRLTDDFPYNRDVEDRRIIVVFRIPVTFGLHNFKSRDIIEGIFPTSIGQISLLPGVIVEIPVSGQWALRPFGNIGWGRELARGGESAWIYWGGIKSRLAYGIGKFDLALVNALASMGYTSNRGKTESLSMLATGFELDHPLGNLKSGGEQLFLKIQVMNYWYFDRIGLLLSPGKNPEKLGMEWDIGLAIRKKSRLKFWIFQFDQIGIAYRFSRRTKGIYLFFRTCFRS